MADVPVDPIEDSEPDEQEPPAPSTAPKGGEDDGEGAGSKQAVLADLARERKTRQRVERELRKIQEANATDAEKAVAAARTEGERIATERSHKRIVRAEVKAAAAGVLINPDIATRLVDLSQFEVDENGEVDSKAIKAELQRLIRDEPYLAAGAKPAPLPAGGATPSQGPSMDDALRTAARSKRL